LIGLTDLRRIQPSRVLSWLGVFLLWTLPLSQVLALDVIVVSSSSQASATKFVQALLSSPELAAIKLEQLETSRADEAALARADVVVAVGVQSAQKALSLSKKPVLAVMLSEASYQELAVRFPQASLAGIVLDQPASRQLGLFKALWPEKKSVGVLLGAPGSVLQEDFQREASALGLPLKAGFLHGTQGSVAILEVLMDGREAIIAPWDGDAFNAQNARVILLTTYRAGLPLLAYSAASVEAGALAAVFSTPENIAQQLAEWLAQQKPSAIKLPKSRIPRYFDVALNKQVARSLNMTIPEREIVLQRMREVEP